MSYIEKEFFEAFGIEPKQIVKYELDDGIYTAEINDYMETADRSPINGKYVHFISQKDVYPTITANNILQLMNILINKLSHIEFSKPMGDYYFSSDDACITSSGNSMEECLLKSCTREDIKDEISEEVKALFKC